MRASKHKHRLITALTLFVGQIMLAQSGNMTWPILDKALELIAERNYQPTYVFQEEGTPSKPGNVLNIALAALMIMVPSCVLVAKRHKLKLKS